jgi:hypothetical protein
MADLDQQLRSWVDMACNNPPGSAVRQKALTQIIRTINRKLWREYTPGYEDALSTGQKMYRSQ